MNQQGTDSKRRDNAIQMVATLTLIGATRKQTGVALVERYNDIVDRKVSVRRRLGKAAVYHLIFLTFGSDQWGKLMRPFMKFGLGPAISRYLFKRLPTDGLFWAWFYKLLEIGSDELRTQAEIWITHELGYGVDALATFLTPELWHSIEVGEKIAGCITHPERVTEDENGVMLSIQNIYGNVFRLFMVLVLAFRGGDLDDRLDKLFDYLGDQADDLRRELAAI